LISSTIPKSYKSKTNYMKRVKIYGSWIVVFLMTFLVSSCTEEMSEIRLDSTMITKQSMEVTSETAMVEGFVIAEGSGLQERGICYSTSENPTIEDNTVVYEGETESAAFTVEISGLDYATTYYARSYGMTSEGVVYGDQISFTTDPVIPTVSTVEVTEITGNSANTGGNVTVGGGADVTAYGVVFGTQENPTVDDEKTEDGEGLGEFTSVLEELNGNTTYYVRAYATNSAGTGYGEQISFTTLVDAPVVVTSSVEPIEKTLAGLNGEVTYDGGGTVSARGFVWGTTENPTMEENVINSGDGVGVFSEELNGLTMNTTYHVRAFATNSYGTSYGENVTFTTLADITKLWIVGDYNGWDNSDNAKFIISTEESNGLAEGYVYLTVGGIKLALDHSWSNAATFGDDGLGGLTNPGDNISVPADGYYRIQANLIDMTYSLVAMEWGVIGDASPSGWDDETPLTYDIASDTWRGVMHLTAGEMKFRANHNWDYNYGSTAGNEMLDAGGANIPIALEADYSIVLDLSTPNEYTYSAHHWGVIGDATPGGWADDTNMTWDEVNEVFTVTLDLTAGEFKFRADDAWDLDYGGDLDALTVGGANMTISETGNYTITFDPWTLVGTVTQN
jgi:hypothetical protein